MSTPDDRPPPAPETAWPGVAGRLQRLLRAVGSALAAGGGADVVLQSCCQALVDHVGASFARIWTLAPGEDTLTLQASAGIYTRLNGTYSRVRVGDAKIGRIASLREPHLTNDVQGDARIVDRDWATRAGMVAFAGLPLVADEEVVGVMALFAGHPLEAEVLTELDYVAATMAQFVGREQAAALERLRLAQELHDTVSQALYGIRLAAESGRRAAAPGPAPTSPRVNSYDDIIQLTDDAQAELRALILGIRPDSFERDGLVAALSHLVLAFRARYGVVIEARLDVEPRIGPGAKRALYRIAQEALANAGRHARASEVAVELRQDGEIFELLVSDNGRGFTVEDHPGHLGLRTMRERARSHGWDLDIRAAPGEGCRVSVRVPVEADAARATKPA